MKRTLRGMAEAVRIESTETENTNQDWRGATAYVVTLRYKGRRMTTMFCHGPAICHEPTAEGVLDCLLSDAMSGEETFEGFCSDLGYDPDSRKAEATWKACARIGRKLHKLLGNDFDAFSSAERP